jgi:hypothetical protein
MNISDVTQNHDLRLTESEFAFNPTARMNHALHWSHNPASIAVPVPALKYKALK